MNKTVHVTLDLHKLPPLTRAQRAELAALAASSDSGIDTSDIAPLDEDFWARAVPNPFFKPVKTPTSIRLDADVLAWLKSQGKGYQSRINAILRAAMLSARQQEV